MKKLPLIAPIIGLSHSSYFGITRFDFMNRHRPLSDNQTPNEVSVDIGQSPNRTIRMTKWREWTPVDSGVCNFTRPFAHPIIQLYLAIFDRYLCDRWVWAIFIEWEINYILFECEQWCSRGYTQRTSSAQIPTCHMYKFVVDCVGSVNRQRCTVSA